MHSWLGLWCSLLAGAVSSDDARKRKADSRNPGSRGELCYVLTYSTLSVAILSLPNPPNHCPPAPPFAHLSVCTSSSQPNPVSLQFLLIVNLSLSSLPCYHTQTLRPWLGERRSGVTVDWSVSQPVRQVSLQHQKSCVLSDTTGAAAVSIAGGNGGNPSARNDCLPLAEPGILCHSSQGKKIPTQSLGILAPQSCKNAALSTTQHWEGAMSIRLSCSTLPRGQESSGLLSVAGTSGRYTHVIKLCGKIKVLGKEYVSVSTANCLLFF